MTPPRTAVVRTRVRSLRRDLARAERVGRDARALTAVVLAAAPDRFCLWDVPTGRLIWESRTLSDLLGSDVLPLPDQPALGAPDDPDLLDLDDGEVRVSVHALPLAGGATATVSQRAFPHTRSSDGRLGRVLTVQRDVTHVVQAAHQLERAALTDPLTGLPNRRGLVERLRARGEVSGPGTRRALLFCDLDGFARINDGDGHASGDAVLRTVAKRLRAQVREPDLVARVGGDEFAVVAEGSRSDALLLAERLRRAVSTPVRLDGREHALSLSVGVAYERPDVSPGELLRDAGIALHRAKQRGCDSTAVFDADLLRAREDDRHVERMLRSALADDGQAVLQIAYQPVVDVRNGSLRGFEALARLSSTEGPILPARFIPVAEATGLIADLGAEVLSGALHALAGWQRDGASADLSIAVNLSALQVTGPHIEQVVLQALALAGVQPTALVLELTESVLLEASASTLRALRRLRDRGIGIAIDDFGTGYGSLRYLSELPVTSVKVDRSFTARLPDDPTCGTIVRAVAGLARDLRMNCVVEGVETEQQRAALPAGVLGQGWLFGRPVDRAAAGARTLAPQPRAAWLPHPPNGVQGA